MPNQISYDLHISSKILKDFGESRSRHPRSLKASKLIWKLPTSPENSTVNKSFNRSIINSSLLFLKNAITSSVGPHSESVSLSESDSSEITMALLDGVLAFGRSLRVDLPAGR